MNPMLMAYILLALAIVSEVTGSTFLVKSEGFTQLVPSILVVVFHDCPAWLNNNIPVTIEEV